MTDERLKLQLEFVLEIDKEKNIFRQTHLSGHGRNENDAEHAWHMAVMTLLLSEYANEEIDVLRVLSMLLIHDLVEIDAGDTYAYDEEGKQTQRVREVKAADRLYGILPEDQGEKLRELWEEFEEAQTPEAKFALVIDNVQPAMLIDITEGKDWIAKSVRLSQILERNAHTAEGSQKLWDYAYTNFIEPNVKTGKIKDDTK